MKTRLTVAAVVAALAACVAPIARADDAPQFTDWTSVGANVATGTLLGSPITLSGTHVFDLPTSVVDGSWPYFAGPDFSPPIAKTDEIQIAGFPGDAYSLQFGAPVTNPVLEIGSLGSRLDFPSGTQITRRSGDAGFSVSGSSVVGTPTAMLGADSVNDANGTVQLSGTFTSISFTATPLYVGPEDGVLLQVGAVAPPPLPPVPAPAPTPVRVPPGGFPRPISPFARPQVDIHVTGIEVTQAVQSGSCFCAGTLPSRDLTNTETPGQVIYQGVKMAAGHFTVVRVFANFTVPATSATLSGATAQLEVLDSSGQRISLLTPDSGPAALSKPSACGSCVGADERANAGASFNFLVPWQETFHRTLSFRATVSPARGLGYVAPPQCPTCKGNTFLLSGVPFVSTAAVPIHPIPLTVGGARTSRTENDVFSSAQTVLPLNVQIMSYEAPLAVDTPLAASSAQASAAVAKRASDEHLAGTQYPIGVFVDGVTQALGGSTDLGRILYGRVPPISIVRDDRPLTSAMHEIGHGLGLVHADTGSPVAAPVPPGGPPTFTGPHPDGTADCKGNSNGQVGEAWPPDNKGLIQGIGLDRRNWDIFRTGSLPRAIVAGYPSPNDAYYDFMSYCANINESATPSNRPDAWISIRNWNRLIDFHPPAQTLPARAFARAAGDPPLRVIATADATGTHIYDVAPGEQTASEPTAGSDYHLELRDAGGGTLTSVVPDTTTIHVDGAPNAVLLEATLPFVPSTAALVVTDGGTDVARRARSAHAPTATVNLPRPGSHVGDKRSTLVQWTAGDADGDHLTSTVDYSADQGRHWKVMADSVSGTSVRLPSRALSASRNGTLRVRVSDGFNVATATSGRLVVTGSPPVVRIEGLGAGGHVRANATLLLRGTAFDDAGEPLTGARLRWYVDNRLIGHGELMTVQDLPTHAKSIRLVATDTRGRTAQARVPLKVVAVPPTFLVAHAPITVSATARRIRITVASSDRAVLTIAGVPHAVDRKPRALTIRVRPGHSTLRLKYALRGAGGVTRGIYVITR